MKTTKTKTAGKTKKSAMAGEKPKTTKAKTAGKTKKTVKTGEKLKTTKVTARKKTPAASTRSTPSEEDIRQKAYEIYHQRLARGEAGNDMDDWKKAVELLKGK